MTKTGYVVKVTELGAFAERFDGLTSHFQEAKWLTKITDAAKLRDYVQMLYPEHTAIIVAFTINFSGA